MFGFGDARRNPWKRIEAATGSSGEERGQSSISRRLVRDPEESVIESRIFADFRGGSFGHGFSRAAAGTAQCTAWQPGPQAPPVDGSSWRLRGCADASAPFAPETLRAFWDDAFHRVEEFYPARGTSRRRESEDRVVGVTWRPGGTSSTTTTTSSSSS